MFRSGKLQSSTPRGSRKTSFGFLPTLVLAFVFTALLTACGDDGGLGNRGMKAGSTYRVAFIIRTVDDLAMRAVSETDEHGLGRENYIDVDQSTFLLFTNNAGGDGSGDTFIARLTPESVTPADDSAYPDTWTVVATISNPDGEPLSLSQLNSGYKIVLFANCTLNGVTLNTATTLGDLCRSVTYDYGGIGSLDDLLIPMYGVLAVGDSFDYQNFVTNWVGTLYVLRSMAKIEIVSKAIELKSVKANSLKWNDKGYVAPDNYYTDIYDWAENNHTVENRTPHIPASAGKGAEALDFIISDNRHSAVIYVPEFGLTINQATGAQNGMTLSVTLLYESTDEPAGDSYTTTLNAAGETVYVVEKTFSDFRIGQYYNGIFAGEYFNVLRNYYYTYEVSYTADTPLNTLNYTVCRWNTRSSGDIHFY